MLASRFIPWLQSSRLAGALPALLLVAALAVQYRWLSVPSPVNLAQSADSPAKIGRGRDEFIIDNPDPNTTISHTGTDNEVIEVVFNHAHLAPETIALLKKPPLSYPKVPTDPVQIEYRYSGSPNKYDGGKTDVHISTEGAGDKARQLHLFQHSDIFADSPDIEMHTIGTELHVTIATSWPAPLPQGDTEAKRLLLVGGIPFEFNNTPHRVSLITDADPEEGHKERSISLRFLQPGTNDKSLWEQDGFFRPFTRGGTLLSAAAFRLQAGESDIPNASPPVKLSAHSLKSGKLLRLEELRIGRDELQAQLGGTAMVSHLGVPVTANLLVKNKLLGLACIVLDVSLFGLFGFSLLTHKDGPNRLQKMRERLRNRQRREGSLAVVRGIENESPSAALERKTAAGIYDVFLCHNGHDKPAVKEIAEMLKAYGIRPWLDVWEIRPGDVWIDELDRILGLVQCAAVFVGPDGTGPWERMEIRNLLRRFVSADVRVIPVLLPDATEEPDWSDFLDNFHRVDFGKTDPDPIAALVWGITGQKPAGLPH